MSAVKRNGLMRSGELSKLAGVSKDTVRHYERIGLIARPQRSPKGFRDSDGNHLHRILVARRALSVGFTLDELVTIFRVRDLGGTPCRTVRALATAKLAQLEQRLEEIKKVRDQIRQLIDVWDEALARAPAGRPAELLGMLLNTSLNPEDPAAQGRRKRQRRDSLI